jgi:hypothetical protein
MGVSERWRGAADRMAQPEAVTEAKCAFVRLILEIRSVPFMLLPPV